MATLHKTVHIARPVDEVWNVVGDIGGIAAWFRGIDASRVEGNKRLCDFEGGFSLEEEIVFVDDANHRYQYRITDGPFSATHHLATVEVTPAGEGARVAWTVEVEPDELAGMMDKTFERALPALRQTLETPAQGTTELRG
jgi:carbon monoxide dehydrogenase subunit G